MVSLPSSPKRIVVAAAALQRVVPGAAVDLVIAGPAVDPVAAVGPDENVVALATDQVLDVLLDLVPLAGAPSSARPFPSMTVMPASRCR